MPAWDMGAAEHGAGHLTEWGARAKVRGRARTERGGQGQAGAGASAEHGDGVSTDTGMGRVSSVAGGYGSEREDRDSAEHRGR